jgi:hypothetical protein
VSRRGLAGVVFDSAYIQDDASVVVEEREGWCEGVVPVENWVDVPAVAVWLGF